MTQPDEIKPNFVLIDPPEQRDPVAEAIEALSIDTPSTEITPDMTPELSRLMNRMFLEF